MAHRSIDAHCNDCSHWFRIEIPNKRSRYAEDLGVRLAEHLLEFPDHIVAVLGTGVED